MRKTLSRIWVILVVILSVFMILSSCSSASSKKVFEIERGYKFVEEEFKNSLYDPSSVKLYGAEGVYADGYDRIYYKITYNQKSIFGEYIGVDVFYCTYHADTNKVDIPSSSIEKKMQADVYEIMKDLYQSQEDGEEVDETYFFMEIK